MEYFYFQPNQRRIVNITEVQFMTVTLRHRSIKDNGMQGLFLNIRKNALRRTSFGKLRWIQAVFDLKRNDTKNRKPATRMIVAPVGVFR